MDSETTTRRGVLARPFAIAFVLAEAWLLAWLAACAPDLPDADAPSSSVDADEDADAGADAGASLELEPEAPLDRAFPVLRLHLRLPGVAAEGVDLAQIAFVHGKVTLAHLRQIARGEISSALSERIVPSLSWTEGHEPGEAAVVVAPTVSLVPGDTYALALGTPPLAWHLQVAAEGTPPIPILARIWPPIDKGGTVRMGVWCGDEALPAIASTTVLAPLGPEGELRRGAVGDAGARCLRFEGDGERRSPTRVVEGDGERRSPTRVEAPPGSVPAAGPFVGPPSWGDGAPIVSLDPRPFAVEVEPKELVVVACDPGEIPFGPGCASVADDRLLVRPPDTPLLWAIQGEKLDVVLAADSCDPFVIAPLPSLSPITLHVSTVDVAGRAEQRDFSAITLAPMAHVVITEVLANPLGAEPDQEWVELYNDGSVAADLGEYVLLDVGGETPLPSASLAPGSYALIANQVFVEDDELDPPPEPGVLIVRVPKLGKGGLSNAGEPLQLKDKGGATVSRTPAAPKPKPGMSLARLSPGAPDGVMASFALAWPTPGRENILEQETP